MQIQKMMKDMMTDHKQKIEIFQWAVMNGVSSLIYSEFIRRMKQKQVPTQYVMVPKISEVSSILKPDGPFMQKLSDELIDQMIDSELFARIKYTEVPELEIFTEDKLEILKTIFDLYIAQNVYRRIPEVIAKKFQIGSPEARSSIVESSEVSMFDGMEISRYFYNYIVESICSQLVILLPTINKSIRTPEDVKKIQLSKHDILIIEHKNAICPVMFTSEIFDNAGAMDLLSFVTNISVTKIDENNENQAVMDDGQLMRYVVSSNPFNSVSICNIPSK